MRQGLASRIAAAMASTASSAAASSVAAAPGPAAASKVVAERASVQVRCFVQLLMIILRWQRQTLIRIVFGDQLIRLVCGVSAVPRPSCGVSNASNERDARQYHLPHCVRPRWWSVSGTRQYGRYSLRCGSDCHARFDDHLMLTCHHICIS